MTAATSWILPLLLCFVGAYGLRREVDVYDALCRGAEDGLRTLLRIVPALIALLPAVYMFRASGILEWLGTALAPVWNSLGLPPETIALMLVRPLSGSGAVGVAGEIIRGSGPDSYAGRVAAVMLGSTETTFYTVAVYFGAAGIRKTRHAIPAALTADVVGFIAAALTARLFFKTA